MVLVGPPTPPPPPPFLYGPENTNFCNCRSKHDIDLICTFSQDVLGNQFQCCVIKKSATDVRYNSRYNDHSMNL